MYPGGYEIQGGKTSALSQLVMERELMTRVIGHRLRTGKNVFVLYVRGQDKVGSRDDDPYSQSPPNARHPLMQGRSLILGFF